MELQKNLVSCRASMFNENYQHTLPLAGPEPMEIDAAEAWKLAAIESDAQSIGTEDEYQPDASAEDSDDNTAEGLDNIVYKDVQDENSHSDGYFLEYCPLYFACMIVWMKFQGSSNYLGCFSKITMMISKAH